MEKLISNVLEQDGISDCSIYFFSNKLLFFFSLCMLHKDSWNSLSKYDERENWLADFCRMRISSSNFIHFFNFTWKEKHNQLIHKILYEFEYNLLCNIKLIKLKKLKPHYFIHQRRSLIIHKWKLYSLKTVMLHWHHGQKQKCETWLHDIIQCLIWETWTHFSYQATHAKCTTDTGFLPLTFIRT